MNINPLLPRNSSVLRCETAEICSPFQRLDHTLPNYNSAPNSILESVEISEILSLIDCSYSTLNTDESSESYHGINYSLNSVENVQKSGERLRQRFDSSENWQQTKLSRLCVSLSSFGNLSSFNSGYNSTSYSSVYNSRGNNNREGSVEAPGEICSDSSKVKDKKLNLEEELRNQKLRPNLQLRENFGQNAESITKKSRQVSTLV